MATQTSKRRGIVLRSSAAPKIARSKFEGLKTRTAAATRRLREASQGDTEAATQIGAAVALGLFEKSGRSLPTVMGIDPALVWGTAVWAFTRNRAGKSAGMARAAGIALATVGVNRSVGRGSVRVAGDDSYEDDSEELEDDEL